MTQAEIEALALQVANPKADWKSLVRHLIGADAVANIAADMDEHARAQLAEELRRRSHLGRAAGCPKNVAVTPWLEERGILYGVTGPRIVRD